MPKTSAPAPAATQDEELPQTAVKLKGRDAVIASLQDRLDAIDEPAPEPQLEANSPEEDATFKKRYGDLRRYAQQKETKLKSELETYKAQVEQLTAMANKPMPKTKEEFEAWKNQYPDIVTFIEMIADEKASVAKQQLQEELGSVQEKLQTTEKEKAYNYLLRLVPDLEEIIPSAEYKKWFAAQPEFVKQEINGSEDPEQVSYYMNIYKTSIGKVDTKRPADKLAALNTSLKNTGPTPSSNSRWKFTASQIKAMSVDDFAKNEQAIQEARMAGLIYDDMSRRNTVFDM